jgi:hypothetical protein
LVQQHQDLKENLSLPDQLRINYNHVHYMNHELDAGRPNDDLGTSENVVEALGPKIRATMDA